MFTIVAQVMSAIIVLYVFWEEKSGFWKTRQQFRSWLASELKDFATRSTLIFFLISVSLIFVITYFAYNTYLGAAKASDYALFGGPCVAGMVAGFGLLFGQPKEDRSKFDLNILFYLLSVIVLILCYLVYLASHPSRDVYRAAEEALAGCILVAIVIKRLTDVWRNSTNDWLLLLSVLINIAGFVAVSI